jgi:hypothetical protein
LNGHFSVFARAKPTSAVPVPLLSAHVADTASTRPIAPVPATRRLGRQTANALLLHGLRSDGADAQSRITSHLPSGFDASLSPHDEGVLLTLSPPTAALAALERLRGALAFDATLGCASVELVCVDGAAEVLWREKATPAPSRVSTPSNPWGVSKGPSLVARANAFAALEAAPAPAPVVKVPTPTQTPVPIRAPVVVPEDWEADE